MTRGAPPTVYTQTPLCPNVGRDFVDPGQPIGGGSRKP